MKTAERHIGKKYKGVLKRERGRAEEITMKDFSLELKRTSINTGQLNVSIQIKHGRDRKGSTPGLLPVSRGTPGSIFLPPLWPPFPVTPFFFLGDRVV